MRILIRTFIMALVALASISLTFAQEVSIPDPGLNAAIRTALQKPTGPLTQTDLLSLTNLSAGGRNISDVTGLEAALNLRILDLDSNSITNFTITDVLTNLTILDLFQNHLTNFTLSNSSPNLTILDVAFNSLTNCSLPAGLTNLDTLFLEGNTLTNMPLPAGLAHLTQLDLSDNDLTNLTLPPEILNLTALFLAGNPLATLVLPEPLAATNLAGTVTTLQNQGVAVMTYPLAVQLTKLHQLPGAIRFAITGPPGDYIVLNSTNLTDWSLLGAIANPLGGIFFTDTNAHFAKQRFYHAVRQSAPANMVFVSPSTFTMGSAPTEDGRSVNEGPQTTVVLTRGYWIAKFEVTQGEYLSVMNTNPSEFPGDLNRPVSSVRWMDATNYCWMLTQRELAAGRIPAGSRFRLPTEAEWECAARAGTTTRFSYGDDPGYASATNYMWQLFNADLTVHPVGQKLPNPWGLYDMSGNVWEWCLDWYDTLPGGVQVDPAGPPGPVQFGEKVMRGGAYDYPDSSCRSASRLFFPATEFHTDMDLGFRVVLVIEP